MVNEAKGKGEGEIITVDYETNGQRETSLITISLAEYEFNRLVNSNNNLKAIGIPKIIIHRPTPEPNPLLKQVDTLSKPHQEGTKHVEQ